MSNNVAIFMDGTWNDPTERTNVYTLFQAVKAGNEEHLNSGPIHCIRRDGPGVKAFYLEGVGAHGRSQGFLGGTMGVGLHARVLHAYLLASREYQKGDKFWIFGFSRGAWSARSLAGFIAKAGLLAAPHCHGAESFAAAQHLWARAKSKATIPEGSAFWEVNDPTPIHLVGVWDTVGALGIPFFNGIKIFDFIEKHLFEFADLQLSNRVSYGRQALSIDESRKDFEPTLWDERADGTISQVWFPGVHCDVGGGYGQKGLSDIALEWMLKEAHALGGANLFGGLNLNPDPCQDRHDEAQKPLWKLRPIQPRKIPPSAVLHPAVMTRLEYRDDYRPKALAAISSLSHLFDGIPREEHILPPSEKEAIQVLAVGKWVEDEIFAQNCWNACGIAVKAGESYRITATGKWTDKEYVADADGYPSPNLLMKSFEGGRRLEDELWFRMIACINPDPTLETKNLSASNIVGGLVQTMLHGVGKIDESSQLVAVGKKGVVTAEFDGYLYLFANDCLWAYGNNSGYLAVKVERIG